MTGDADQSRAACPVFAVGSTPSLLYPSSAEQAALSDLRHALLDGSPLTLLLGDDGIGKTQLLNAIRTRLSESHKIASIRLEEFEPGDPQIGSDDDAQDDEFIASIRDFAHEDQDEALPSQMPTLLIVDDAHLLPDSALDQLHRVCEALSASEPPVQLLLAGLPVLRDKLDQWQDSALGRYIGAEIRIAALTEYETAGYVAHRFATVDCDCHSGRNPFDAGAMVRLHHYSQGVPGRIGAIARTCLSEAERAGATVIGAAFVDACERGEPVDALPPPSSTPAQVVAHADRAGAKVPGAASDMKPVSLRPADEVGTSVAVVPPRGRGWIWTVASATVLAALAGGLIWTQISGRGQGVALVEPAGPILTPTPPSDDRPLGPREDMQTMPEPVPMPPPPQIRLMSVPDTRDLLDQAIDAAATDPAFAALLYERAALLGDSRAAYFMGQVYELGDGVSADPQRARAWYRSAVDSQSAADRLAELGPLTVQSGAAAAPVPVLQASLPDGRLILHWRTAGSASPPRFAVDYMSGSEDSAPHRRVTALSAILLEGPVSRWRIVSLSADDRDQGATEWFDAPSAVE
ncbi:AAA family ATPase [Paracoccus seriniphilus]|uniref:Type II secretory pathway, component ExeA (Predicted ATPase) n=1 Tax=Paracoccus seriniphilus TaxID=184748 RepID=A0A239Q0M8_9RHOB|nr:AAA family ATPase [Paracoccus seriniphilus]WCR16363.1 SEL1-like repeat protein [Paracoccus seriniphilus]SNT75752.1 Type II secretory pathway, component ExeA (predicted ATPase) [Paracoccus seriniphilus]